MRVTFKSDTSYRKGLFVPESFAHPAKMIAPLLLWIVERYTEVGQTILDPMAGSGTAMLACPLGRNVVMVELEQKFMRMQVDNWQKVSSIPQLGYTMAGCSMLWGDARNMLSAREHPYQDLWVKYSRLDYTTIKSIRRKFRVPLQQGRNLEGLFDSVITSPPYAEALDRDEHKHSGGRVAAMLADSYLKSSHGTTGGQIGNLKYGEIDAVVSSPPYEQHHQGGDDQHPDRMEGSQSGDISRRYDAVISSPPYEGSVQGQPGIDWTKMDGGKRDMTKEAAQQTRVASLSGYDAVVTSPPYENQVHRNSDAGREEELKALGPSHYVDSSQPVAAARYDPSEGNIGNLKSTSYLEAMLQVYQQCHSVLRDGGVMVLVTKDFIRDQKRIDLAGDTIRLCEEAGFIFSERHYRNLTQVSFWRTIYKKKFPDAPEIDTEDILVFLK